MSLASYFYVSATAAVVTTANRPTTTATTTAAAAATTSTVSWAAAAGGNSSSCLWRCTEHTQQASATCHRCHACRTCRAVHAAQLAAWWRCAGAERRTEASWHFTAETWPACGHRTDRCAIDAGCRSLAFTPHLLWLASSSNDAF